MYYLFFDIECADGNFKICEFGYVITDESFNVLTKKNMLINPQCPFNLTGREGQEGLILSYPYEEYYKHPPFVDRYGDIKFLLTRNDFMIFGHAVRNDIGFLDKSCRYRKVEPFDYVAYDIQKMLPIFSKANKKFTSLEKAFTELVPEKEREGLIAHRACDDAHETMLVLKWMVKDLGFTVPDIIDACPNCRVMASEYLEQKREYQRKKQRTIRLKAALQKGNDTFLMFLKDYESLWEKEESIGKFVTVSMRLKQNEKALGETIDLIRGSNYIPVEKTLGSDMLIALDAEDIALMQKEMRHPYMGCFITLDDFKKLF